MYIYFSSRCHISVYFRVDQSVHCYLLSLKFRSLIKGRLQMSIKSFVQRSIFIADIIFLSSKSKRRNEIQKKKFVVMTRIVPQKVYDSYGGL